MFKKPFSFKGRIRRTEFGLSYILYIAGIVALSEFIETAGNSILIGLLFIPLVWFLLAQGAKRCHDRGNSGFYQLIPFYVFWMLFADGETGENEFGLNPKGIGNSGDVDEVGKHLVE